MSNSIFEAHCASNDSNIIAESKIITIKNEFDEKIMLKTPLLAKSNPVKLLSLKVNFYGALCI